MCIVTIGEILSEHLGLLSNFLINLFGVFIGVYLALRLDRRERRKIENQERRRISESLKVDLQINLERIKSKDEIIIYNFEGIKRKILLTAFNTATLESVINSGKLTLFDTELQANLSDIHQVLTLSRMMTDRLLNFMTSIDRALTSPTGAKQILDWLLDNLQFQYKGLEILIPQTLKNLEKQIEREKKE